MNRQFAGFFVLQGILLLIAVLCWMAAGCSTGSVYEYRVIEEIEGGFRMYAGDEAPRTRDGWIELVDGDEVKVVSAQNCEIKRVQIGPHQCQCGAILRTYRDRCHQCGVMILLGCRTPPKKGKQ